MKVFCNYFATNLLFLRLREKKSQEALAESVGSDPGQISSYECGKTMPRIETMVKFADHFDVTLDALVRENLEAK